VFFAVVGGLRAFGVVGLFVGPLILSITVALFRFLREERRSGPWRLQFYTQPGYEGLDEVTSAQPKK